MLIRVIEKITIKKANILVLVTNVWIIPLGSLKYYPCIDISAIPCTEEDFSLTSGSDNDIFEKEVNTSF